MAPDEAVMTRQQVGTLLRSLGWVDKRGLWRTEKRGLKAHTRQGLLLEEAASIEAIDFGGKLPPRKHRL